MKKGATGGCICIFRRNAIFARLPFCVGADKLWAESKRKEECFMTLGQRIQMCRKRRGLSQEQLGEQVGVSRQAVHKKYAKRIDPSIPVPRRNH